MELDDSDVQMLAIIQYLHSGTVDLSFVELTTSYKNGYIAKMDRSYTITKEGRAVLDGYTTEALLHICNRKVSLPSTCECILIGRATLEQLPGYLCSTVSVYREAAKRRLDELMEEGNET